MDSPSRRSSTELLAALALVSSCALVLAGAPRAAADDAAASAAPAELAAAWDDLWGSHLDRAITVFRGILEEKDKRNAIDEMSARRGLALAYLQRGHERAALDTVLDLEGEEQAGPMEFLLASWIYSQTSTHGKDEREFQKLFEKLADRERMTPLDRRFVLSRVGHFALSNGDAGKARKIGDELNRIRSWSILGPFDNTSGSGHGRDDLDGATRVSSDVAYTGKAGQSFHWTNPRVVSLLGDVDFDNHFARSRSISAYAGACIEVEKSGPYLLSFARTGALRVVLDSTLLCDLLDEASQNEYHHFEVDLPAGVHTLLLKVSGEEGAPLVAASFSTAAGKRPADVRIYPLMPASFEKGPVKFRERTPPMIRDVADRAAADPTDAESTYWHLAMLIQLDREDEIREFAPIAADRFPDSAIIRLAVARAYGVIGDTDKYREHMREGRRLDPGNALAQLWEVSELLERDKATQADSLLTELLDRCPEFPRAEEARISLLGTRGLVAEMVRAAEEFGARYPDYPDSYTVLADYYETLDRRRSRRLRRQALDRTTRGIGLAAKYAQLADADSPASLLQPLEEMYELFPDAPAIGSQVALTKLRNGDMGGIELSRELAVDFPYSYEAQWLRATLAELLSAQDRSEEQAAIHHYER
ncbi:hypothetical protein K8I85_10035, partial [bacterium]|nr:hypothetical protein [bacterium]